ncbi:MAG: alginate lyase family protein [Bacteroidales bacterium]|nr:alginate lyase family protein [Bacteroidales bacterium]
MALIGSEEDEKIVAAVRRGLIEEVYGEPVGWGKYERSEIEKSVWLNRFYFLPSFARMYHLTGDRSYLDDMMGIISQWITDNPRMPDSHRTTYNWRDMQVAWRSIHLSWCWYLGEKGLTAEEKELIIDSLKEHAHILVTGFGQAKLNEFNHQSHGALAMLYLGVLFPMLDEAEELRRKALIILNHHLENAFYADGGNVEQMFGYYPFETHLFRDAFLLCTANGLEPPLNSLTMLRTMVKFLVSVERPDGTVPQVNDSYEMPVVTTVDTVNEILGAMALVEKQGSVYFPDTQVAVLRDSGERGWYLLANPASVIGAHAHAGRLGFELWHKGAPLIIESGCCNYDDPALVNWYRTTRAHNTVVIDGMTEAATSSDLLWVPRRETPNRIKSWVPGEDSSYLTMVSPPEEATNASVRWTRTITTVRNRIAVISDTFEAEGEHEYEILLHFPPSQIAADQSRKALTVRSKPWPGAGAGSQSGAESEPGTVLGSESGPGLGSGPRSGAGAESEPGTGLGSESGPGAGSVTEVIAADSSVINALTISDGLVSMGGVSVKAPMASYTINGSGTIRSHLVVIPTSGNNGGASVKLRKKQNRFFIAVREADGRKTRIASRMTESA